MPKMLHKWPDSLFFFTNSRLIRFPPVITIQILQLLRDVRNDCLNKKRPWIGIFSKIRAKSNTQSVLRCHGPRPAVRPHCILMMIFSIVAKTMQSSLHAVNKMIKLSIHPPVCTSMTHQRELHH